MSSREPDQSDFDLNTFIDLFDEALSSDDPRVKRALKDLLIITTLIRSADCQQPDLFERKGPLRRLFDDLNNISRRVNTLEHNKIFEDLANQKPSYSNYPNITVSPNINPYYPTTSYPYGKLPGTSGIFSSTSTQSCDDSFDKCNGEDC